jgi:hypothetical protein
MANSCANSSPVTRSIAGSSTPAGRGVSSAREDACRSGDAASRVDGSLQRADVRTDPYFGLAVQGQAPGVEPHSLEPIKTWRSKAEFAEFARRLVQMFRDNFKRFETHADEPIRAAGPNPRIALA